MWNDGECGYTTHQDHTHSTESREVRYPWHPWFGRVIWIKQTRVNQGQLIVRCALEQRHDARSIELAHWMFDSAVCCQMRMAEAPLVGVEALRELRILLALSAAPKAEGMLQDQHHTLPVKGGADASLTQVPRENPTSTVSSAAERSAVGPAALGDSAAHCAVTGTDATRTLRSSSRSRAGEGGSR